jgi:hypothetical protein
MTDTEFTQQQVLEYISWFSHELTKKGCIVLDWVITRTDQRKLTIHYRYVSDPKVTDTCVDLEQVKTDFQQDLPENSFPHIRLQYMPAERVLMLICETENFSGLPYMEEGTLTKLFQYPDTSFVSVVPEKNESVKDSQTCRVTIWTSVSEEQVRDTPFGQLQDEVLVKLEQTSEYFTNPDSIQYRHGPGFSPEIGVQYHIPFRREQVSIVSTGIRMQ